ncbi:phytoene/squalene synthase family protein [Corynebacterium resistens]
MKSSPTAFSQYSRVAEVVARDIIRSYSSSFSLASRLLGEPVRTHIRNIYGMVRVADEIVDGAAAGASLTAARILEVLDEYERATFTAISDGFSPNPLLQAFAHTARWAQLDTQHIRDFFHSMRLDAQSATQPEPAAYDSAAAAQYIHGSAGVVGWMCNAVFMKTAELNGNPLSEEEQTQAHMAAYSLGSAFQKVNFLRDYHHDSADLARLYLPQLVADGLTESAKRAIISEIHQELRTARLGMYLLPPQAHGGVQLAHDLFLELTEKLESTPAAVIAQQRVRVPHHRKLLIAARVVQNSTVQRCRLSTSPTESSSHPTHRGH